MDDSQSQVYLLTKVIQKEVFDINDTMDIMAQVLKRQEQLLIQKDQRLRTLEQHLEVEPADTIKEEDQYKIDEAKFYVQSKSSNKITSRHHCKYTTSIKNGKIVKTSNRNDVLLGNDTALENFEKDDAGEDSDELCGIHAH